MEWDLDWPVWHTKTLKNQLEKLVQVREKQRNLIHTYHHVFTRDDLAKYCNSRTVAEKLLEFCIRSNIVKTNGSDLVSDAKKLYSFTSEEDGPLLEAIYVGVLSATNVAAATYKSTSDPYVKISVQCGSSKTVSVRTNVASKTTDPQWNQVFVFFVDQQTLTRGRKDASSSQRPWISKSEKQTKFLELTLCSKSRLAKPDLVLGSVNASKEFFGYRTNTSTSSDRQLEFVRSPKHTSSDSDVILNNVVVKNETTSTSSNVIRPIFCTHGSHLRNCAETEVPVGYMQGVLKCQFGRTMGNDSNNAQVHQGIFALSDDTRLIGFDWVLQAAQLLESPDLPSVSPEVLVADTPKTVTGNPTGLQDELDMKSTIPDSIFLPLDVRHREEWKLNICSWLKERDQLQEIINQDKNADETVPFLFREPEWCFMLLALGPFKASKTNSLVNEEAIGISTLRFVVLAPLFKPLCTLQNAHILFEALMMHQFGNAEYAVRKSISQPFHLFRRVFLAHVNSLEKVWQRNHSIHLKFDKTFPMIEPRLENHEKVLLACRGVKGSRGDQSIEVLGLKRTTQDNAVLFITNRSVYFCKSKVLRRDVIQEEPLANAVYVAKSDGSLFKGLVIGFLTGISEQRQERDQVASLGASKRFVTFRFHGGTRTRDRALLMLRNVIASYQFKQKYLEPCVTRATTFLSSSSDVHTAIMQQCDNFTTDLLVSDAISARALWHGNKVLGSVPPYMNNVANQLPFTDLWSTNQWTPFMFLTLVHCATKSSPKLQAAANVALQSIALMTLQRIKDPKLNEEKCVSHAIGECVKELIPFTANLHCWCPEFPLPKRTDTSPKKQSKMLSLGRFGSSEPDDNVHTATDIGFFGVQEAFILEENNFSVKRLQYDVSIFDKFYIELAEEGRGDVVETLSQLDTFSENLDLLKQILRPVGETFRELRDYIVRVQRWDDKVTSSIVAAVSLFFIWYQHGVPASTVLSILLGMFAVLGFRWRRQRQQGLLARLVVPTPRPKVGILDMYKNYRSQYRRLKSKLRRFNLILLKLRGLLTWENSDIAYEFYGFFIVISLLLWLLPATVWQTFIWIMYFTKPLRSGRMSELIKQYVKSRWERVSISPLYPYQQTRPKLE